MQDNSATFFGWGEGAMLRWIEFTGRQRFGLFFGALPALARSHKQAEGHY